MDAKQALYASLATIPVIKYAIVVDDDIDIHNRDEVIWVLEGRCQPDRDITLISDVSGFVLDPSLRDGDLTSKLGIDATKPLDQVERFERIGVPQDIADKAAQILSKYL